LSLAIQVALPVKKLSQKIFLKKKKKKKKKIFQSSKKEIEVSEKKNHEPFKQ
jgi:hypothetical protein